MKILSYRFEGLVRFGPKVKKEEAVWDVLSIQESLQVLPSFPQTIVEGIANGMDFVEQMRLLAEAASKSENPNQYKRTFTSIEWLSPIPRTPKNLFAVGRNYADHAKEMGSSVAPENLMVFTKSPTTIAADEETLSIHSNVTSEYDYEGELAVVISKRGDSVPAKLAYDHVFGYTIANDLTARDLQIKHQQYFLGKSLTGSCPMGPYIVTKDELPDPQSLSIVTKVNNEVRQNGHTNNMIFSVEELIVQISALVTLEPGDVILTGTPSGVGKGFKPPKFLAAGDTVKVSIEGIGTLINRFE